MALIEDDIVVAAWAMYERSYNCQQLDEAEAMDEAEAIKLAMSKLTVKRWRKIIVQSSKKQLLQQIQSQSVKDIKMHTLIEDIISLKSLFCMCFFCFRAENDNHVSNRIGDNALGILHDE